MCPVKTFALAYAHGCRWHELREKIERGKGKQLRSERERETEKQRENNLLHVHVHLTDSLGPGPVSLFLYLSFSSLLSPFPPLVAIAFIRHHEAAYTQHVEEPRQGRAQRLPAHSHGT